MEHFKCPQCASTEFQAIENIAVDSENKILESQDNGERKCSNCGTRFLLEPGKVPTMVQASPSRSPHAGTRVRSSVSAEDRGIGRGMGEERKY